MEVTATRQRPATPLFGHLAMLAFFLGLASLSCYGQESVSAGGKWVRIQRKDPASSGDQVSFVLVAEPSDPERHPDFTIVCSSPKKPPAVIYNSDVRLAPTIRDPLNYFSPAMWAWVKAGHEKVYKAVWDIPPTEEEPKKAAVVDRKTTNKLLSGETIKVLVRDYMDETHTDEFEPGGLNINDLRDSCGAKWFGKGTLSFGKVE